MNISFSDLILKYLDDKVSIKIVYDELIKRVRRSDAKEIFKEPVNVPDREVVLKDTVNYLLLGIRFNRDYNESKRESENTVKSRLRELAKYDDNEISKELSKYYKDIERERYRFLNNPKYALKNMVGRIVKNDNYLIFKRFSRKRYIGSRDLLSINSRIENLNDFPIILFNKPIIKETGEKTMWLTVGVRNAILSIVKIVEKWVHEWTVVNYLYHKKYDQQFERLKFTCPTTRIDLDHIYRQLKRENDLYTMVYLYLIDGINKSTIARLIRRSRITVNHFFIQLRQIMFPGDSFYSDNEQYELVLCLEEKMRAGHPKATELCEKRFIEHINTCNLCRLRAQYYQKNEI